jgi:hypothetical protein
MTSQHSQSAFGNVSAEVWVETCERDWNVRLTLQTKVTARLPIVGEVYTAFGRFLPRAKGACSFLSVESPFVQTLLLLCSN